MATENVRTRRARLRKRNLGGGFVSPISADASTVFEELVNSAILVSANSSIKETFVFCTASFSSRSFSFSSRSLSFSLRSFSKLLSDFASRSSSCPFST